MQADGAGYELTFETRPDYLFAQVSASSMDRQTALEYLSKISEECKRTESKRLLVVRDVPVMLTDSDLFFTTNDFANMIKGVRVAFVNPYTTIDDHMDFAMMIATNRGARFTLHPSIERAEAWLLESRHASVKDPE